MVSREVARPAHRRRHHESIAPLAPYVNKLLIPRGICAMNEWTANNTGPGSGLGQGNDPHLNVLGSYFILQPVTPSTNNPLDFST